MFPRGTLSMVSLMRSLLWSVVWFFMRTFMMLWCLWYLPLRRSDMVRGGPVFNRLMSYHRRDVAAMLR